MNISLTHTREIVIEDELAGPPLRTYTLSGTAGSSPPAHTLILPVPDRERAAHLIARLLTYARFRVQIEHIYLITCDHTTYRHLAIITYRGKT